MFFDASGAHVPAALDLDAAHYIAATSLVFASFDTAGNIDGLVFDDDDDILMFDRATEKWFDFYDGTGDTREAALINGAVGTGCTRCDDTFIENHIASILGQLDIDDDGEIEPLFDGVLATRWLFGFRGNVLVQNAVDLDCGDRCDAADIEPYLDGLD